MTDSKNAEDQANAQQALQSKIAEAQTLLDNSLYAVDDNSTRVTLESDIANANTVLSQQGTDVKAMQDAVNTLVRPWMRSTRPWQTTVQLLKLSEKQRGRL